jgi:hypothetical protein
VAIIPTFRGIVVQVRISRLEMAKMPFSASKLPLEMAFLPFSEIFNFNRMMGVKFYYRLAIFTYFSIIIFISEIS